MSGRVEAKATEEEEGESMCLLLFFFLFYWYQTFGGGLFLGQKSEASDLAWGICQSVHVIFEYIPLF